jgi:hypothetical protein
MPTNYRKHPDSTSTREASSWSSQFLTVKLHYTLLICKEAKPTMDFYARAFGTQELGNSRSTINSAKNETNCMYLAQRLEPG